MKRSVTAETASFANHCLRAGRRGFPGSSTLCAAGCWAVWAAGGGLAHALSDPERLRAVVCGLVGRRNVPYVDVADDRVGAR